MILTFISYEKNLGILPLTDFFLQDFGRDKVFVVGWNYLISDFTKIVDLIKEKVKEKNVIIKYIIPKVSFSNQEIIYPDILKELSDVIFKVPTYKEELNPIKVPLTFYKGEDNPVVAKIKKYYS